MEDKIWLTITKWTNCSPHVILYLWREQQVVLMVCFYNFGDFKILNMSFLLNKSSETEVPVITFDYMHHQWLSPDCLYVHVARYHPSSRAHDLLWLVDDTWNSSKEKYFVHRGTIRAYCHLEWEYCIQKL